MSALTHNFQNKYDQMKDEMGTMHQKIDTTLLNLSSATEQL